MYLKGRYKSNLLKIALLCCILSGCDFLETQYTCSYPDGSKDYLEYKFDGNKLKLLDTRTRSYGFKSVRIDSWFDDCQIFNEENWYCRGSSALTALESIQMVNGEITWRLGDEERVYKKTYKFQSN